LGWGKVERRAERDDDRAKRDGRGETRLVETCSSLVTRPSGYVLFAEPSKPVPGVSVQQQQATIMEGTSDRLTPLIDDALRNTCAVHCFCGQHYLLCPIHGVPVSPSPLFSGVTQKGDHKWIDDWQLEALRTSPCHHPNLKAAAGDGTLCVYGWLQQSTQSNS